MQNNDVNQVLVEDLSFHYKDGIPALNNVNMELKNGFFGLLGGNGSGKSTLMKVMCTLEKPSGGNVSICGLDVVKHVDKVRELIGYLPQEFGAWRLLQVDEVLNTMLRLSGKTDKTANKARIQEVLETVGLEKVAKSKVGTLSGGMVRRVGIAQAMIHNPRVIILDEATVGLDLEERSRFRQLIEKLAQNHIVLLTTHIISDLSESCSKLFVMRKGHLAYDGTPADMISKAQGRVIELPESSNPFSSDSFEVVSSDVRGGESILRGVIKDETQLDASQLANAVYAKDITLQEAYVAFDSGFA